MTVPAGSPIWTRSAAASTYGGSLGKKNYGGIGAINANTDVTAEQWNRLTADLAGVASMTPLCMLQLNHIGSAIYIDYCAPCWTAPWREQYLGSSPPSALYPSAVLLSATQVQLTFPQTATDEFGVAAGIAFQMAIPLALATYWIPPIASGVIVIEGVSTTVGNPCPVLVF